MRSQPPRTRAKSPEPPREALHSFGARLRAVRRHHELTQEELGAQVRLPASMISRYERGLSQPTLLVALRLRRALHVTLDYLLAGVRSATVQDTRLLACCQQIDTLPEGARQQFVSLAEAFVAGARGPSPAAPPPA
jgi:transcriptional regulator with XRE-family HTH domain